jgi:hypothetical protein
VPHIIAIIEPLYLATSTAADDPWSGQGHRFISLSISPFTQGGFMSYRISQEINAQVILWAIAGIIYSAGCAISRLGRAVAGTVSLPLLLRVLTYSAGAVVIGGALLALFALVAAQPAGAACLLGLLAVAYATYPR